MRLELNEAEYQSLLEGAVGDLDTFLDMYFASDWRETNEAIDALAAQFNRFSETWQGACASSRYSFRVSDQRRHHIEIAVQHLQREVKALQEGRVTVQRRWQGIATRYCLSLYWHERGGGSVEPSAKELMKMFRSGNKANMNKDSQGLQFAVDARRRAVSEFIARNREIRNTPALRQMMPDNLRPEAMDFLEVGDDKDFDLSGAIYESARKIAREWESFGRVPDPSEISPLCDPHCIWVD